MTAIEIARRLSQIGQSKDACNAYVLVLQMNDAQASERLEACCYLLENGEDFRLPITALIRLFQEGFFSEDIFRILTGMFYQPYEREFRKRHEKNCKLLSKYPYLFRKDFLPFERLPRRFLPFGGKGGYVPFIPSEPRFAPFVNVRDTIITRNFFRDLEKPVLADDVYSQYELEYLRDNVRPSEYVGKENHVYLHYFDWPTFCSWLQILDFKNLLKKKQFVFLIGDEINRYPIDFKSCFGIDYGQYPTQRVKIREVKRLIWHAQLSSSNGGDFFNEILDAHPNLLYASSMMYSQIEDAIENIRQRLQSCANADIALKKFQTWSSRFITEEDAP